MKRWLITSLQCLGVLALSVVALVVIFWKERVIWPSFPEPAANCPSVVTKVERDFAHRTGDRIPVEIYLKQEPGCEIDLNSVSFEGDYEVAGQMELYVRDRKDGTRRMRLKLQLQSFNFQKSWNGKATMSYRLAGKSEEQLLEVKLPEMYTSRTWDGRDEFREGKLEHEESWHWVWTALLLAAGVVGAIWAGVCLLLNKQPVEDEAPVKPTRRGLARRRFDAAWRRITAGDTSAERFEQIGAVVRWLYRVEALSREELPGRLGKEHRHLRHVMAIAALLDKRLCAGTELSADELAQLKAHFDATFTQPAEKG